MNFHYQLEDQVSQLCAVFVSVVSTHTETAVGDNYFRRERYWAAVRAQSFSDPDREKFYLPFLLQERPPAALLHEPRIFVGCRRNSWLGGAVPTSLHAGWRRSNRGFGRDDERAFSNPSQPLVSPEAPWLGLRAYTENLRDYFFGRERELGDLFERVAQKPLTVLFGQSGLGKTSLLQAALVPRLGEPNSWNG